MCHSTNDARQTILVLVLLVTMATASRTCKDFATFNAGLIMSVPEEEVRRPKIIEGLAASTADFICLQEIWFERDMSAILDNVEGLYPHHYSDIHYSEGVLRKDPCVEEEVTSPRDTACALKEVEAFVPMTTGCGEKNGCFHLDSIEQGICLATKCVDVLRSGVLSETCVSCLFNNFGLAFEGALRMCATPGKVHNRFNDPGLLVLSRVPFKHVFYKSYFPDNKMAFQRGYIEAELEDGKLVVCTHTTSIFHFYLEYDLQFGSYKNQSMAEIAIVGERFSNKDHVLMGDINTGPLVVDSGNPEKDLGGEFPENYELLISFGYKSPYLQHDGRCTFCQANPYTGGYTNNVIDQVMLPNTTVFDTPEAMRTFDNSIPPLSDHYGVKVRVCDP